MKEQLIKKLWSLGRNFININWSTNRQSFFTQNFILAFDRSKPDLVKFNPEHGDNDF
jgi:hypothetical protein